MKVVSSNNEEPFVVVKVRILLEEKLNSLEDNNDDNMDYKGCSKMPVAVNEPKWQGVKQGSGSIVFASAEREDNK